MPSDWTGLPSEQPAEPAPGTPGGTTDVPRPSAEKDDDNADPVEVTLIAQLTADGQAIDQGLIWRVYDDLPSSTAQPTLLMTLKDSNPTVKLKPGNYLVNAAFGRAHLTRKISLKAGAPEGLTEPFVLNAGGLRVGAVVGGSKAPANLIAYSIFSDRDQSESRKLITSSVKLGTVVRLNAGIYHVVSTYGDANATVASDVTVEAGKLTEATITHSAAKATFRLVARPGGEAVADTQWMIQTPDGAEVKESVGALPTHILAPGTYTVTAQSQGKSYQRDFTLADGQITQVEVVIK